MRERKLDELNQKMAHDLRNIGYAKMAKIKTVSVGRGDYAKGIAKKCGKLFQQCLTMLNQVLNGYDAGDVSSLVDKGNPAIIIALLWRRDEDGIMNYLKQGKYDADWVRESYKNLGASDDLIEHELSAEKHGHKLIVIKLPRRKPAKNDLDKDKYIKLTTIDDLPDELFK
ncbi:MAG: hypothetical protein RXO22_03950 [Thermocladium sp.]|jgi:hypothetical protein